MEKFMDNYYQHGSILHEIAMGSDKKGSKLMELHIKGGANVNARNDKMWTPLHCAVLRENKKLVCILLENNAKLDCTDSTDDSTPLLIASKCPSKIHFEIIKLLANSGANPNAKRRDGRTAMHDLASLCTDKTIAKITLERVFPLDAIISATSALIEAGANVNSRDSNGFTPLHVACEKTNYRFMRALLEHGADVNIEDHRGRSVCCLLYRNYDSSKWLHLLRGPVTKMINLLQTYVIKMNEIGLLDSRETLFSVEKCANLISCFEGRLTILKKKELIDKCRAEMQIFKDTKIRDDVSLYDALFKSEDTLLRLVKNPAFEAVVKSESFEKDYSNYGYLVKLKYRTGMHRAYLLSAANRVLSDLAGLQLPDVCSENICQYFKNVELKESIEILDRTLMD